MAKTQSLQDFYRYKFNQLPDIRPQNSGQVNVFRREDHTGKGAGQIQYTRRDFYKITLIRGEYRYHYADRSVQINGPALLFFNPQIPYTWESLSDDRTGYFCIFKEEFFTETMRINLQELPMFRIGGKPAYGLTTQQDQEVSQLFEKILNELASTYSYKYDLIRNYVSELIHVALKLQPSETLYQHPDAKARITAIFRELLERQFPIESPAQRLALRSAGEFARQLSVHINHLNWSIRETTGKTTTDHIAERVVSEARSLLKHTDWNIAQISYSLGFDEPAHFNNFFKKKTQLTPLAFRNL